AGAPSSPASDTCPRGGAAVASAVGPAVVPIHSALSLTPLASAVACVRKPRRLMSICCAPLMCCTPYAVPTVPKRCPGSCPCDRRACSRDQQGVDGDGTSPTDTEGQRHPNEGDIHFDAVPFARLERPVEEEPMPGMDFGDGHQHHGDQPEGRRPNKKAHEDRETADALRHRGQHGEGRWDMQRFPEVVDRGSQSLTLEPPKHELCTVRKEDDPEEPPDNQQRPRWRGSQDELHTCLSSSNKLCRRTGAVLQGSDGAG